MTAGTSVTSAPAAFIAPVSVAAVAVTDAPDAGVFAEDSGAGFFLGRPRFGLGSSAGASSLAVPIAAAAKEGYNPFGCNFAQRGNNIFQTVR